MLISQSKSAMGIPNLAWSEVAGSQKLFYNTYIDKQEHNTIMTLLWRMQVGLYDFRIQWSLTTLMLGETDLCCMALNTSFETMTNVYIWRTKDIPIVST